MKALLISAVLLTFAGNAMANGKILHDQSCLQCHAALMVGKANMIYSRNDRKVNSLGRLENQVAGCAVAAGVDWQALQIQQVVDYLATTFYRFK